MVTTCHPAASRSVLVIDDDAREIRLLSQMLRPEGYTLFAALSGEEGFKRALARRPDLVLLDMNMPGLDGRETCRLFKGAPALSTVPVIFLTASGLVDDKLSAFALGAVDYITKPFSAQEVAARLRVHLRLWVSPAVPALEQSGQAASNGALEAPPGLPGERLVRTAQRLLLARLSNPPGLVELAHELGTNERRLTEEFRRHAGMPVFEFLRQERHRRACELLLHSDRNIGTIAAEVGFQSMAAFSFAFRKYCGLTPSQYRQAAGVKDPVEDPIP
ncbi:MAG: response regulator transcription factor [Burkholderiales bacterium]|nr:MAG: response regulator transcription factor [Burkholderiales bacterium]